jgi:hypothetical protein
MNQTRSYAAVGAYAPIAIYYDESDSVEYLREDVACVYRRIDNRLTLALEIDSRALIGFRLKGFKNFYIRHIKEKYKLDDQQFLSIIPVLEEIINLVGVKLFEDKGIKEAYENAFKIAEEDHVLLKYFPEVA